MLKDFMSCLLCCETSTPTRRPFEPKSLDMLYGTSVVCDRDCARQRTRRPCADEQDYTVPPSRRQLIE